MKGLAASFLSTQVLKKRWLFYHNDEDVLFTKNEGPIVCVEDFKGLPWLSMAAEQINHVSSWTATTSEATDNLWHQRLSHATQKKFELMAGGTGNAGTVRGMTMTKSE